MHHVIALFGEAERGQYAEPIKISNLSQLADYLGNPPEESVGITLAIQALLYQRDLLYLRVQEEGFSTEDYLKGLQSLEKAEAITMLHAVCMPGVGDAHIIEAASPVTEKHNSLLITTEQDLYDYLTSLAS